MNWINTIQKAINYIEDNLLKEIDIEEISAYVHFSSHHLQKIFYLVTGLSISEYIRNRRLSYAGQMLKKEENRVIDVALQCGYSTHESFTKAFTRFHGFTPSKARYSNYHPKCFDQLSIQIYIKGGFMMSKKMLSRIPLRQLIKDEKGQNYWLNGCMHFLMECIGESPEYDYWFFSGITGDSFLQIFSKNPENMALCYSHNVTDLAVKKAFDACGYNYDYIRDIGNETDRSKLDQRIRDYIDKSIPVIARVDDEFHSFAIICGYDENTFYYILGEDETPSSYHYDELIFVTDKKSKPSIPEAYRDAVMSIPTLITMPETDQYSFGKKAFIDWAESFQNGLYDEYPIDSKIWSTHPCKEFSCWNMHGTYLCILGTNGCATEFLEMALKLNPDMVFIKKLIPLFAQQNLEGFAALVPMQEGFHIKPEVIKDRNKMKSISEKIVELSKISDDIIAVYQEIER